MPNDHILTTHVGSLPRTPELLEANLRRAAGEIAEEEFFSILQASVDAVVKRQVDLGIDIVNEGEYGHVTSGAVDYGAWWNYIFSRLGGLTMTEEDRWANQEVVRSTSGNIALTSFQDRRDRQLFSEAYEDPDSGIFTGRAKVGNPKFTGPITYIGGDEVATDARLLTHALTNAGSSPSNGFIAAISPGAAARLKDEYYHDDTAVVQACADALHHEYKAITDAGLTVQLDAPDLAEAWDQINPEPSVEDYCAWLRIRIDAINSALKGLPANRPACTSAGVPGMARTPRMCPSRRLLRRSCVRRLAASPSRVPPHAMPTSGACGAITPCRRARSSTRAWSRTR